MFLNKLLENIETEEVFGSCDIDIKGLSYDSRKIEDGYMFFALNGTHTDGAKFVNDAIAKGAVCVVSCSKIENCNITNVVVKDITKVMADIAAKFYGYPDKKLFIIGVTGTNGKTSITYMLESILKKLSIDIGVIGTITYRYANTVISAPNTTPQSLDLFKMMAEMVESKIKYLIMEVSSHSLVLGRILNIEFDVAVFTNLTQDHLDFHKNMENYFSAKKILFTGLSNNLKNNKKFAIINTDDFYGRKLFEDKDIQSEKISYSIKEKVGKIYACAEEIVLNSKESSFNLISSFGNKKLSVSQIGLHNIYNLLAVFCICSAIGIGFDAITENFKYITGAPGRLDRIDTGKDFSVVVDYAHTDDALKNVISALKNLNPSRIITVFGCGGNRDKTKRPKMAKAACSLSDYVFITSDNPREENPVDIIKDVEQGAIETKRNNYKIVVDRKDAICDAIKFAKKGDVVLIAGKGHENYQIVGTKKFHFDDKETALEILNNM
ncbi:MAG: UDP-N-acetylmuramoyl-L-alanyl-D-glutamate--2,6-diaminopimelate ligase [Elusimicrobia bacterium]|nr:UDP-N-acetylmuramoyl-L-alanyl-D-glutamate--2,6-diaminopimelate ligase [Elusimicrobiota bacterium]